MKEKRKGKYGSVEFVDKRKLRYDGYDDNIEPEFRKPTPTDREEIILNFIRAHSGKSIRVWWLAEKLGVSDRTIQKILKKFEEKGLINRTPLFTDTGKQRGNILTYLGEQTPIKKTDLTLKKLYDPDNPCGFRDWDWEYYKFIPGYYDENFTRQDAKDRRSLIKSMKDDVAKKREKFLKQD